MKIIYSVGSRIPGGGIGNIAFNAIKEINKQHYLKKLICTSYDKKILNMNNVATVPLIQKIPFYYIKDNIFDLMASRKIEEADIFHGWSNYSLFSMRKAKKYNSKTIIERHSAFPLIQKKLIDREYMKYGFNKKTNRLIKKEIREFEEADRVLISSKFILDTFEAKGFNTEKIDVIPLGVDTKRFRPSNEKKEKFRILFVGQISIRKGIPYLLEAFDSLPQDCELILMGHLIRDMKDILKKYKKEQIKIINYTPNPSEFYKKASVCVLPSIEDGFGLVVLEAMASGIPVIVSEHTGAKDAVINGKNGFIVATKNAKNLNVKLSYLYNNQNEIKRMGKNARKTAEKYTWENYNKKLIKMYENMNK